MYLNIVVSSIQCSTQISWNKHRDESTTRGHKKIICNLEQKFFSTINKIFITAAFISKVNHTFNFYCFMKVLRLKNSLIFMIDCFIIMHDNVVSP